MAYVDIQNRIASDLRRDDLSSDIQNAINDAVKFWEDEAFLFNEKRYQLITVQGQEYYSIAAAQLDQVVFPGLTTVPTNMDLSALAAGEKMLEIETMTCKPLSTGLPYPVTARTQAWFDKNQANPTVAQGLPEFYTMFDAGMRIYPVPNGSHTLTLSGLVRLAPVPFVNSTDTNGWLTEGEGLIREQAKAFLFRDIIGDMDAYDRSMRAIHGHDNGDIFIPGHLTQLKRKAASQIMTGRVEAWSL